MHASCTSKQYPMQAPDYRSKLLEHTKTIICNGTVYSRSEEHHRRPSVEKVEEYLNTTLPCGFVHFHLTHPNNQDCRCIILIPEVAGENALPQMTVETNQNGNDRDQVNKLQLSKILFDINYQCHHQEVRKVQQVFSGTQTFHKVHYDQVQVQIDNSNDARHLEPFFGIEMKCQNKNVS